MARFLRSKGFEVKATDIDPSKTREAEILRDLGVDTEIGVHHQTTFNQARAIIPSPGIPTTIAPMVQAMESGVEILGELDIFSQYNTTPVIAITGTNGKTTTTTLCRDMLEASGISTFMGGNIGTPLMDYLMEEQTAQVVVAEVSSFQLDLCRNFHPRAALLLNITQDHLNRYAGFDGYTASKWRIFGNQTEKDLAVINVSCPGFARFAHQIPGRTVSFSSDPHQTAHATITAEGIEFKDLPGTGNWTLDAGNMSALPGAHNRENIAAAAMAAMELGATPQGIRRAIDDFKGLPHRIALVRELDGVLYYNDSKGTNVDAVNRALECFDTPVLLIMGGQAKGADFAELIPNVQSHVRQILAIGESADQVENTFSHLVPVEKATDMKAAVARCRSLARQGEIVLLSPAGASFDMYPNYGARGDDFTQKVKELDRG